MLFFYKLCCFFVRLIPRKIAIILAKFTARVYLFFGTSLKKNITYNLSELFHKPELAQALLANYFIYFTDFLKSSNLDYVRNIFNAVNFERIEDQLKKGKGVITLTAHFGFWEAGPLLFLMKGLKTNVIYQPYKDTNYSIFFESIRNNGINWMPVKKAAKESISALKRNELVATAVDIDYSGTGIYVPFMGRKLRMPLGPAVFSYHTQSPIVICYARLLENKKYTAEFEDVIYPNLQNKKSYEVERICLEIALCIENKIKKHPEQWFMLKKFDEI